MLSGLILREMMGIKRTRVLVSATTGSADLLAMTFEDARHGADLTCGSSPAFTFAFTPKIAFIQFNRAIQYFSGILLQMRRNDPGESSGRTEGRYWAG